MVCDLAVAITKAELPNERLQALLGQHLDQITQLVANYLQRRHPRLQVKVAAAGCLEVGDGLTLRIDQTGAVTLEGQRTSRTAQYLEDVSQEVTTFVALVADQLFAQEVERSLRAITPLLGKQTADVENAGKPQRAVIYAVRVNGLKVRVFVLPGARLQVFVDDGNFEQAKTATQKLLQAVQAQGVEISRTSEIEQHRSGSEHVHIRQTQQRGGQR